MTTLFRLVILLVFLAGGAARANMRAPFMDGGDLVAAHLVPEALQGVVLDKELLTLRFPRLKEKTGLGRVEVVAEYILSNSGASRELDLIFFATEIGSPQVAVNGSSPRSLSRQAMDVAQVQEFWQKQGELRGIPASDLAHSHSRYRQRAPQISRFQVRLRPGTNVVRFSYVQAMLFEEHNASYRNPRYHEGTAGLDYLLYPAKRWPLGPRFALELQLEVPDLVDEGWLWDDYYAPSVNLALTSTYQAARRATTFRGRFAKLPADILAVRIRWKER